MQWGQCLDTDWAEPRVVRVLQSDLYLMRLQSPTTREKRRRAWRAPPTCKRSSAHHCSFRDNAWFSMRAETARTYWWQHGTWSNACLSLHENLSGFRWHSRQAISTTNILNVYILGEIGTGTEQNTTEYSNRRQSVLPRCRSHTKVVYWIGKSGWVKTAKKRRLSTNESYNSEAIKDRHIVENDTA